ncbi:hypothetical protein GE278_22665 (plasmid) [Enterobacteriaceae bacterium Kacie_13]|nr:hypothetical protein GE278_22665 [Enterobacteriaceae bacterium Kacie_13]
MDNTRWHWGTQFQLDSRIVLPVLVLIALTLWVRLFRHTREWLKANRVSEQTPSKMTLLQRYGRTQLIGESIVAFIVTLVVFWLVLTVNGWM